MIKSVIPRPKFSRFYTGRETELIDNGLTFPEEFSEIIGAFKQYVSDIFSLKLNCNGKGIVFIKDSGLSIGEYKILIRKNSIQVTAFDCAACGYACASLLLLAEIKGNRLCFPCGIIRDLPDLFYRGLMIDLARKYHPFPTLLKYVDLCFIYKINHLHLHFVDDESFTLPCRAFPKLSDKNASYSKEQIVYLTNYAKERNITIIPEIETIGHAKRFTTEYPEIFQLTGNGSKPLSILCLCREKALSAIKKIIDEIIELFPNSPYIHIGGDEADIECWKNCTDCIKYMTEHNLDGEKALYSHLIKVLSDYVHSKGRKAIAWEGFPEQNCDEISKELMVGAFESLYFLPDKLVKHGFKVINCTWQPLYITPHRKWGMEDILRWNAYRFENFWEKSFAYNNPITVTDKKSILGAQLCSWESDYDSEIPFVKSNLAALSQRVWNSEKKVSKKEFISNYLLNIKPIVDKLV